MRAIASAGPLPEGGYGSYEAPRLAFFSVPARTREARRHVVDREEVEKERLRARRAGYATNEYAEPGAIITAESDPQSAMYQADTDRFYTDVAAEERHLRAERNAKKNADYMRKRDEALARDEERWRRMEAEAREFDEKTLRLQADGRAAAKNLSGIPYDPINASLRMGHAGAGPYLAEQAGLARAQQARSAALDNHSRSVSYDPVTGRETGRGTHREAYRGILALPPGGVPTFNHY